MDNPEKLAIQGKQDIEKQNTICDGHHYTQINDEGNPIIKNKVENTINYN
jgi:hypothetical protein